MCVLCSYDLWSAVEVEYGGAGDDHEVDTRQSTEYRIEIDNAGTGQMEDINLRICKSL